MTPQTGLDWAQLSKLLLEDEESGIQKKNRAVDRSPLWSSGQSPWLQINRSWVRFQALPDFLRSSGSGTGSNQPREDN
jgi:hypothetical protein